MNVTQIFCDADDFCQRFIPDWKKARLEGEEKSPTRVRARSICESEIITLVVCYHISGYRVRSNGSTRGTFKNTGWQTFPACQVTTVLLKWWPISWCRWLHLCRAVAAKAMALPLWIRRLCVFAKTSASHATKPSKRWRGVVSRQRAGFMALSFIWWSMIVEKSFHFQ